MSGIKQSTDRSFLPSLDLGSDNNGDILMIITHHIAD
jgi:hypothetical protein